MTSKIVVNNIEPDAGISTVSILGIATATNFKTGTTNVHSTGVELANINTGGATATFGGPLVGSTGSFSSNVTISGNLGVAGTVTYEDVTNVDSVGVITARSGINLTGGNITLGDSGSTSDDRIVLGAGSDLMIYHNGSDSVIREQGTGNLDIQTTGGNVDILVNTTEHAAKFISDGAVELYHNNIKKFDTITTGIRVHGDEGGTAQLQLLADEGDDNPDYWRFIAETNGILNIQDYGSGNWYNNIRLNAAAGGVELYFDNSKKMETVTGGVYVYGDIVGAVGGTGNIYVGDNNKFIAGSGNDLQIFHDGSNSKITNATGHIVITTNSLDINNAADNETLAKFDHDGAVELYHNNVKQLETNITGITLPKGGIYGMGGSMALIGGTIVPNQDKTWKFPFNTNHAGTNHGYEFTIEIVLNHWNHGDYYKILERYLFGRGNTTSYQTVTKIDDRGTGSANWNTSHFDQTINLSGGSGNFPATLEITYDAESAPGYTSGYHIFVRHSGGMGVPIIT